jgi:hypothetical protein
VGQVRFHRRPFTGEDAVDAGVAQRAVRIGVAVDLVRAQHAVELGAQAFDAAPALVVEEVRAELHRDAVQRLEGVPQQQALAFGVERAALHPGAVPGGADLDAAVGGVDVHEGGHADRLAAGVQHRERQHAADFLQAQAAFDFGGHALGCGDAGVPELPELAVAHGFDQVIVVGSGQGNQAGVLAAQCRVLGEGHGMFQVTCDGRAATPASASTPS